MNKEINFKLNNIDFKLINTNRYKTITGIISFVRPLDKKDFTYYSLINRLIGSSTNKYKTKKELSNKMYELYDCNVYMSTYYSYKTANNYFVFQTIDGKIVDDKLLFSKCIDLLKEIILNPNVENEGFNNKNFLEEKRALENDIKNVYNNKKKYAFRKLMEGMAPNDIISASTLGDLDILESITPQSLLDFYKQILNESYINVGIIGNVSEDEVKDYFCDFSFPSKKIELLHYPKEVIFKEKVLELSETQDIMQSKLLMAFRYDIDYNHKYYVPLLIFNAMYGSMFGSTLFTVIREQYSLTYDISSEILLNKKVLIVSCGVDNKNCSLASDLVIKELEKYKQGIIDEKLLRVAKDFIINDLKEMQDSAFSSLSYMIERKLSDRPTIDEMFDKIHNVSLDDIKEVSNLIKLDTIFVLKPGDNYEK